MKNHIRVVFAFILGLIISGVTVYAITITGKDISYDNSKSGLTSTNIQDAYDEIVDIINNSSKTVLIHSAALDTIYYYENGNKVELCTTNNNGSAACQIPSKNSITLYSSIAKDPNNLSNSYTKTINLTKQTTEVYLMPDGEVLYWYGYKSPDLKSRTSSTTEINHVYAAIEPVYKTNYIELYTNGASQLSCVYKLNTSGYSMVKAVITGVRLPTNNSTKYYANLRVLGNTQIDTNVGFTRFNSTGMYLMDKEIGSYTVGTTMDSYDGGQFNLHAYWLEK